MRQSWQNKVVWITGASSGIGEALALAFAAEGASLILSARRAEELDRVRQACARPQDHLVLPLDMSAAETLPEKVVVAIAAMGAVDLLINNAGVSQRSPVKDTALDVDRRIMEVDFFGPVALTKALLPHMLARGQGHIAVVSSVVGLVATPLRSAYAAAKHAVIGFFGALRAEVHDAGIRVTILYPGFVRTNVSLAALTGDGRAHGIVDPGQNTAMPADVFARRALQALARGDSHAIIAGPRENLAVLIGRLSPSLLARMIRRVSVV